MYNGTEKIKMSNGTCLFTWQFCVSAVNKVIYDSVIITCTLLYTSLEYKLIPVLTGYHSESKNLWERHKATQLKILKNALVAGDYISTKKI
jgi:hypothetical protein